MIRIANINDIERILSIVSGIVIDLQSQGNNQWTEIYPSRNDFEKDICNNSLYVYEKENKVVGFIVIDINEPIEYSDLNWSSKEFIIVHRFAVDNKYHQQGIGTKLLTFAEQIALDKKKDIIKIDTNIKNHRMKNLFEKNNYNYTGNVFFKKNTDPYVCYEKKVRN